MEETTPLQALHYKCNLVISRIHAHSFCEHSFVPVIRTQGEKLISDCDSSSGLEHHIIGGEMEKEKMYLNTAYGCEYKSEDDEQTRTPRLPNIGKGNGREAMACETGSRVCYIRPNNFGRPRRLFENTQLYKPSQYHE